MGTQFLKVGSENTESIESTESTESTESAESTESTEKQLVHMINDLCLVLQICLINSKLARNGVQQLCSRIKEKQKLSPFFKVRL